MPAESLVEYLRHNATVDELLEAKARFKVSAMALAYAAHKAARLTDWSYRQTCIELSQRGFRSAEPGGMRNYEMSRVFAQGLGNSKSSPVNARMIAIDLDVPIGDVHALTFGAQLRAAQDTEVTSQSVTRHAPTSAKRHVQIV